MTSKNLVAPWVRRFLLEHIVADLNLSRNTQASYRDAMTLLLPFAAKQLGHQIDQLEIERVAPDVVRRFLAHLEVERHCSVSTRNQRLAAIHAFGLSSLPAIVCQRRPGPTPRHYPSPPG